LKDHSDRLSGRSLAVLVLSPADGVTKED
jgi:hypothetical protein